MKIFIICTVRSASDEYKAKLEAHVRALEDTGCSMHLPHRNTDQNARGLDICYQNSRAIAACDEVHIFYNSDSQGTHFDMGLAFAFGKRIKVIENVEYGEGKSYPKMLDEWEASCRAKDAK